MANANPSFHPSVELASTTDDRTIDETEMGGLGGERSREERWQIGLFQIPEPLNLLNKLMSIRTN